VEIEFQNLWDYVVTALWADSDSLKMIDTEGYQYKFYYLSNWRYNRMLVGQRPQAVELPRPDWRLEGKTRTRGWVCFDALPKDVFPARLIKRTDIHEPGHTSGWVRHTEILEFIIPNVGIVTQSRLLQP